MKGRFDASELREVRVHDLANLWMADVGRMTRDEQHALDARIVETLEQDAFVHRAGGAENHDLMNEGYSIPSGSVR